MLVVDAGVLATALIEPGSYGRSARERLRDQALFAPAVIDIEVASVLRGLVRGRKAEEPAAAAALADLAQLPMERAAHAPLLPRVWQLRDNLSAYDAAYVALAELLDAPLLTGDARLARSGVPRCRIVLLEA